MATFDKVLNALRANDQITLESRDGDLMGLDMTLGARPGVPEECEKPRVPGKKRLSSGYGGATWVQCG